MRVGGESYATFDAGGPPAVSEQTLVDATLYVNPPIREGLCFVAGPGRLTIVIRRVTDATEQRPAVFRLNGFMADPDARVTAPVTPQATAATTHLAGVGYYCWDVSIDAPETRALSMAERGSYVQTVAVRITFRAD
jgi:hypothetical protein